MILIQSLTENLLGKWLGSIKPDFFAGLFSPQGQALLYYGVLLYIGNWTPTHSEWEGKVGDREEGKG